MKLLKSKKCQQITRATWIFILLIYFAVITAFLIAIGNYFPSYEVEVTSINFISDVALDFVSGITIVPLLIVVCLYVIPFAFLIYLLTVAIFNPGS
jgi:hypothetical protein